MIHPTAIINPGAELDADVEVGPFCVIDAHVHVAAGCRLLHAVFLTGWTHVEEGCTLHPGVVVGHEPQDTKYRGERSYCRIGRGTILREHVTIHRGTIPESETVIGNECFLLGGAHVAHNCVLGHRVTLINNVLLAGHVEIGDGATLGGGAVVHQFVRIGELAMVPGNARVPMDVVPFALLDVAGRIAGVNRVGLRRSGFSADQVEAIRKAYRVLFGHRLPFRQAAERLSAESASEPVDRIVRFLQRKSRRGLAGRCRTSSDSENLTAGSE